VIEAIREFQGEHRWLSNFWPVEILLDGIVYPTVEHAYQASKTLYPAGRAAIAACDHPGQAKKRGLGLLLRDDWEQVKIPIMRTLLRQKFARPDLRDKLLATGDRKLEEGNAWHDTFWGVDLRTRLGQNWLGRLLMEVRAELRAGMTS
jgi:ribA/ribD-fused uncharacterized protein